MPHFKFDQLWACSFVEKLPGGLRRELGYEPLNEGSGFGGHEPAGGKDNVNGTLPVVLPFRQHLYEPAGGQLVPYRPIGGEHDPCAVQAGEHHGGTVIGEQGSVDAHSRPLVAASKRPVRPQMRDRETETGVTL